MRARRWWTTGQGGWAKFIELFLVLNATAAVVSLGLAPGSEDWFTWTIAPDASARLLGVMYASALVLGGAALRAPDWAHARVVIVLITSFALAATVVTLTHLDPFLAHPWYHLAYWLSGYAVLVLTAPVVLLRQERRHGGRLPVLVALPRRQRLAGVIATLALSVAALTLFVSPAGFSSIWPWELSPLTARLLAVWLGAFAAAHAWALWDGDAARARPLRLTAPITGSLLAVVPLASSADVRPDAGAELIVYASLALAIAAPGLRLPRRRARATRHAPLRLERSA